MRIRTLPLVKAPWAVHPASFLAILVLATGIVLGTLVALATLLPFDSALGFPGLPAGPPWIYLTITASAALLTLLVTRLSTQLLDTRPGSTQP
jgi:putative ABC transport system permease protein